MPAGHVLRRQTAVGPNDCDGGDPYVRENVYGRAQHRSPAKDQDQESPVRSSRSCMSSRV